MAAYRERGGWPVGERRGKSAKIKGKKDDGGR
jgi:hypothetical protein